MRTNLGIVLAIVALSLPLDSRAGNWPQFRGPSGAGLSTETGVPAGWATHQNVAWTAKVPGYGWSSPVVWGDKVFVTTAVSDKQRKPSVGFSPGEFGSRGGRRTGQVLPAFLQDRLQLTSKQKDGLAALQKEADARLAKILTPEQAKQLSEPSAVSSPEVSRSTPLSPRFGGRGQGEGGSLRSGNGTSPGGFGRSGFPRPGQLLPSSVQDRLKLTGDQKKQAEELQKHIDSKLDEILTPEQQKQLKDMRAGPGRGGPGGFGMSRRPPDEAYRLDVCCLDRLTGKVLWQRTAYEGKPRIPTQPSNTYASETAVTDGDHLYAYFGMHGVYCYDFEGNRLWTVDLGAYPMAMGFGTGSSPVLDSGRLFIQCDNEAKSFLVALDAKTGKELWRVSRPEGSGYSTPLIWKNKMRTELVCVGSPRVRSYDPATGKQLWELGGMSGQPKASPVADSEMLYVGTGGGPGGFGGRGEPEAETGKRPLVAVKAGASGDITPKEGEQSPSGIAWYLPQAGPATASPLLYEGLLYVLEERNGLLSCYDAHTGKQLYKERLPGARGFTSSPWACDGKVFCLDDSGTTHVIQAGPQFKLLGKNQLNEMCWASAAVAGGDVFLRTIDHLYCFKGMGRAK
jgi:outer membrane protein assembly factor BamB